MATKVGIKRLGQRRLERLDKRQMERLDKRQLERLESPSRSRDGMVVWNW